MNPFFVLTELQKNACKSRVFMKYLYATFCEVLWVQLTESKNWNEVQMKKKICLLVNAFASGENYALMSCQYIYLNSDHFVS